MKSESSPQAAPILVFFALDVESGYFEDKLKEQKRVQANGFRLVRGIYNEKTYIVVKTGAGRKAAAHAADAVCRAHRPPFVISAGFAGALDADVSRGALVLPDKIKSGKDVLNLNVSYDNVSLLKDVLLRVRWGGTLLTADKVAGKSEEKRALARECGAQIVDMETFEIARVCRDLDLPMVSIRAVTDNVDDEIPPDIQALLKQSSKAGQAGAALTLMWKRPAAFKQLCALRENAMTSAIDMSSVIPALAQAYSAAEVLPISVPKQTPLLLPSEEET